VHWPEGEHWTHDQTYKYELDMIQYAEDLGLRRSLAGRAPLPQLRASAPTYALRRLVAERTTKVKIGTAITVLPFHNPIRAAED